MLDWRSAHHLDVYRDASPTTPGAGGRRPGTIASTATRCSARLPRRPRSTPSCRRPSWQHWSCSATSARLFWDLGGASGDLGPVTVAERAIRGRQQDHVRGIILQQDGRSRSPSRAFLSATNAGATATWASPLQSRCKLPASSSRTHLVLPAERTQVVYWVIERLGSEWLGGAAGVPGRRPGGDDASRSSRAARLLGATTGSHGVSVTVGCLRLRARREPLGLPR